MNDLVLITLNLHTKKDNDYKKSILLWLSYIVSGTNSNLKKSEYYTVYVLQFLLMYLSLFDCFNTDSDIKKNQREEVKCGQCVWKVACGITVFSILHFLFIFFNRITHTSSYLVFFWNIYIHKNCMFMYGLRATRIVNNTCY